MNRRDFIKAVLAIPAIAALPAPLKAAEELLDGITYVAQSFVRPDGIAIVETWHRTAGKVWKCVATEDRIISLTEEPYAPFFVPPSPWPLP